MRRLRLACVLAVALIPGAAWSGVAPTTAEVSVCFTPGPASCAALIANAIDAARVSIRVQAYWLTSTPILAALAAAQRRGVDVEAILDKSQDRQGETRGRYSSAVYLVHAGVRVWIDEAPAIAHNKIIVIDASRVVTGSFNFTKSADTRNAENVVVLDSREVASWFTGNWEARRDVSRAFAAE